MVRYVAGYVVGDSYNVPNGVRTTHYLCAAGVDIDDCDAKMVAHLDTLGVGPVVDMDIARVEMDATPDEVTENTDGARPEQIVYLPVESHIYPAR